MDESIQQVIEAALQHRGPEHWVWRHPEYGLCFACEGEEPQPLQKCREHHQASAGLAVRFY